MNNEALNKEILKSYNDIYEETKYNIKEILEELSDEFKSNYELLGDAQEAYNMLHEENREFMKDYPFVYNLSGEGFWTVSTTSEYDKSKEKYYIELGNSIYNNIKTMDDFSYKLSREVGKIMSNVGCDMNTAFKMILDDELSEISEDKVFKIIGVDEDPTIEIMY